LDLQAFAGVIMGAFLRAGSPFDRPDGSPPFDIPHEEIDRAQAALPSNPDETLR
jgi:hypothetical protein